MVRHGLPYIPQLNDTIILETEYVNQGNTGLAGLQSHARVDGDKITILKSALNIENLPGNFASFSSMPFRSDSHCP
jgi:hypothetical protein